METIGAACLLSNTNRDERTSEAESEYRDVAMLGCWMRPTGSTKTRRPGAADENDMPVRIGETKTTDASKR